MPGVARHLRDVQQQLCAVGGAPYCSVYLGKHGELSLVAQHVAELAAISRSRAAAELGKTDELIERMTPELRSPALRVAAVDPAYADVKNGCFGQRQFDLWLIRFLRMRNYVLADAVDNVIGYLRWIHVSRPAARLSAVFAPEREHMSRARRRIVARCRTRFGGRV